MGGIRLRHRVTAARPRTVAKTLALLLAIGVVSCTDDPGAPDVVVRPVDAITAIIAWQADEQQPVTDADGTVQLPVIFVVAGDGATIDVGVQADVAQATVDVATVRFADDVTDTFDPTLEGQPVREQGVMLLLGAIPDAAPKITVDVNRFVAVDTSEALRVEITANVTPDGAGDEPAARASVTSATPL